MASAQPDIIDSALPPLVLVVDDSISMREGISAIIRHVGCRTATAKSGNEGLARARELSPDLILSDLEMPDGTGLDLLTQLRADPALAMVPFIMITSVADRSSTRRAMELGADDYLTKPFTPDEVMSTVQGRLAKQRNWREATQALAAAYSQGMMGVLPHEFRTPLNSILGFAELMSIFAERGLSPAQTREFADAIGRAGKTLLGHTTRFLTLMELQSLGTLGNGSERCDLGPSWLENRLESALDKTVATGQPPRFRIDAAEATVHCREHLLATMFDEMLGNAIKFAEPDSEIVISGQVSGADYLLAVDNTGSHFPLDKLREIGAFVQFDRGRQEQQGLGIGLATLHHAARLSGTHFTIANLPERTVRASLRLRRT